MVSLVRCGILLCALACALPVTAAGPESVGPFPVREPDEDSPLFVMYEALKAGVDGDAVAGRKAYMKMVLPDRKPDPAAEQALADKEWENLTTQAGSYLLHDLHGFKVMVEEMTPGPAFVKKTTRKVYITLRNKLEGEERRGLIIVERNGKGAWQLRSVSL